MGWRDRDYARWTPDERPRFLGSSVPAGAAPVSRRLFRPGVGLAIAVSAAAFAAGQLPRGHPIAPFLHFRIPPIPHPAGHGPAVIRAPGTIDLPATAPAGGFLTLHGTMAPEESGTVSVDGTFDGSSWYSLATVRTVGGTYTARVQLSRPGVLHLRVTRPDGSTSFGTVDVTG
jgi:hypothetical protein